MTTPLGMSRLGGALPVVQQIEFDLAGYLILRLPHQHGQRYDSG